MRFSPIQSKAVNSFNSLTSSLLVLRDNVIADKSRYTGDDCTWDEGL